MKMDIWIKKISESDNVAVETAVLTAFILLVIGIALLIIVAGALIGIGIIHFVLWVESKSVILAIILAIMILLYVIVFLILISGKKLNEQLPSESSAERL